MDTILNRILTHKRVEVERQRIKIPDAQIRARAEAAPPPRDFAAALRAHRPIALIAEVKKASPSKGVLIENFDPLALAHTYAINGASAISVLTDVRFFQGSLKYLEGIRAMVDRGAVPPLPLLRKDFIIDPYQVAEARAYGADALLLIVAALDDETLAALLALTHSFGMQALVEVHNEDELRRALEAAAPPSSASTIAISTVSRPPWRRPNAWLRCCHHRIVRCWSVRAAFLPPNTLHWCVPGALMRSWSAKRWSLPPILLAKCANWEEAHEMSEL
jgi:indole-3-glycerol phosphate synthase